MAFSCALRETPRLPCVYIFNMEGNFLYTLSLVFCFWFRFAFFVFASVVSTHGVCVVYIFCGRSFSRGCQFRSLYSLRSVIYM